MKSSPSNNKAQIHGMSEDNYTEKDKEKLNELLKNSPLNLSTCLIKTLCPGTAPLSKLSGIYMFEFGRFFK